MIYFYSEDRARCTSRYRRRRIRGFLPGRAGGGNSRESRRSIRVRSSIRRSCPRFVYLALHARRLHPRQGQRIPGRGTCAPKGRSRARKRRRGRTGETQREPGSVDSAGPATSRPNFFASGELLLPRLLAFRFSCRSVSYKAMLLDAARLEQFIVFNARHR